MSIGHGWSHFSTFVTKLKIYRQTDKGNLNAAPLLEWGQKNDMQEKKMQLVTIVNGFHALL